MSEKKIVSMLEDLIQILEHEARSENFAYIQCIREIKKDISNSENVKDISKKISSMAKAIQFLSLTPKSLALMEEIIDFWSKSQR